MLTAEFQKRTTARMVPEINYTLQLVTTSAATGYFTCVPQPEISLDHGLALLRQRPFDDFLRKHLLAGLVQLDPREVRQRRAAARDQGDFSIQALLLEALGILDEDSLADLTREVAACAASSSLVDLRAVQDPELERHRPWRPILGDNLARHKPLPQPGGTGLPLPFDHPHSAASAPAASLGDLFAAAGPPLAESDRRPAEQTIETALDRLKPLDLFESDETRHASCLSPIAYLRKWRMAVRVRSGRNRYTLAGTQTSYGKGLSPEAARASCLMEVVERISSFCSCEGNLLPDYRQPHHLLHERHSDLAARGLTALDPNRMRLDVAYRDEPLYWLQGRDTADNDIYLPAQAVFLFPNFDEVSLFSSLGSTGLAAGNTPEEARLSALLEIIERDADSTVPFDPGACFRLHTDNPHLLPLFEAYDRQGIRINFQEITTRFGVPAFRCFVTAAAGEIIRGTGAHLDGRKAVMAALTETPYPFPSGPPSGPGLPGLPLRRFEDLPNYDTNSNSRNLTLLEALLKAHGFAPVYVDLTRKDVAIPVAKAIVPGLEWLSDFDRLARISPRLFANYLKMPIK